MANMDTAQDMNMDSDATTNMEFPDPLQPQQTMNQSGAVSSHSSVSSAPANIETPAPQAREGFRDIPVKVHIRRPERDSWAYLGRGIVTQEVTGRSSRIVVRSVSSHKILTTFGEGASLQAEKRGNFVVVGCVENNRVVSWSLNALNNSETLRLLAIIELSCYSCKQAVGDPHTHTTFRRRIARAIKDDRRKRHKRRKDQDAMVAAFAKTALADEPMQQ